MTRLRLKPIPAFSDNYIWLLADAEGRALVVDPGDARPVLDYLARNDLTLGAILLTHHHDDHIGGVAELVANRRVPVYAPHDARIAIATARVGDGDVVEIDAPRARFTVVAVPGHTRSHVAYHGEGLLFCGDTLFSVGCGRMFEGEPAQMLASLERLAALSPTSQVCCGHEYTLANCAFATTIEPNNERLAGRYAQARAARGRGEPTLPSTLADERACNPFLRVDAEEVQASLARLGVDSDDRAARFGALRRLKDAFRAPPA